MKIEVHNPGNLPTIDYRKLNPLQGNLKDFHEREYEKLKKSLSEFGWVYPFFVWFNPKDNLPYIMDGHGRHRFATREGIQPFELPYVQVEAENLTQAKKLLLVATSQYQRITQEGFDEFAFDLEDDWLKETVNFDGVFSDVEIPEEEPEAHEDDYEAPDEIKTDIVLGDLFEIGKHRLLCGDSTDSDQVAKLMNGEKADMVFTDPPYGVSFVGIKGTMYQAGKKKGKDSYEAIKNDDLKGEDLSDLFKESLSNTILFTTSNCPFYIFFAINKSKETIEGIKDLDLEIRNWLIWDKGNVGFHAMGAQYKPNYESFLYCFKNGNPPIWKGSQQQQTIWRHSVERLGLHPTMKPISLVSQAVQNHDTNLVLDVFLGSGSTMVAAHQLNRKCYGMELDPKYCQVIIDRMLKLDPTLEVKKNGEPFIQEIAKIENE